MIKTKWLTLFSVHRFEFGEQPITQFIVFECKYLFSIIFFYFHKSQGKQDRYHTHAFNGISFKFFGQYDEFLYNRATPYSELYWTETRDQIIKYFPKSRFHKIGNSTGCLTLLISGPWEDTWLEKLDVGGIKKYSWGRNKIIDNES